MRKLILLLFIGMTTLSFAQAKKMKHEPSKTTAMTTTNKMVVEIWSDVMCPFCYIGKRKLEIALEKFPERDRVEIIWKSFQLNPDMKTDTSKTIFQYLSENKGISVEQAKQMVGHAEQMAKESGLVYHLDKSVVANSFKAHRFSHFAKEQGRQDAVEEQLFKAYFTDSKNTDDDAVLLEIAQQTGLDTSLTKKVLQSDMYAEAVKKDIYEAQQIGVRGVPFFALNRKYAISGAQDSDVMLGALQKAFAEWQKENPAPSMQVIDGKVCTPDGECK